MQKITELKNKITSLFIKMKDKVEIVTTSSTPCKESVKR